MSSPGASREDWKILRAVSEVLGATLPYDDIVQLRNRLWDVSPTAVRYEEVSPTSEAVALQGLRYLQTYAPALGQTLAKAHVAKTGQLQLPIKNFYQTDPISRSSVRLSRRNTWRAQSSSLTCFAAGDGPMHESLCRGQGAAGRRRASLGVLRLRERLPRHNVHSLSAVHSSSRCFACFALRIDRGSTGHRVLRLFDTVGQPSS